MLIGSRIVIKCIVVKGSIVHRHGRHRGRCFPVPFHFIISSHLRPGDVILGKHHVVSCIPFIIFRDAYIVVRIPVCTMIVPLLFVRSLQVAFSSRHEFFQSSMSCCCCCFQQLTLGVLPTTTTIRQDGHIFTALSKHNGRFPANQIFGLRIFVIVLEIGMKRIVQIALAVVGCCIPPVVTVSCCCS